MANIKFESKHENCRQTEGGFCERWTEHMEADLDKVESIVVNVLEPDDTSIDYGYMMPVEIIFYTKDELGNSKSVTVKGFNFGTRFEFTMND